MNELTNFPRPSVTIDCVVFGYDGQSLSLLLLSRREEPFKDMWTLPGGFLYMDETPEESAKRILKDKTGLANHLYLEQLFTFGALDRDPRGRVLSVAYYTLVDPKRFELVAGSAAKELQWFDVNKLPKTGFDHKEVIKMAISRLKAKVTYQPIGFELLEKKFTLTELQFLYECILQRSIDKRNFRKRMLESRVITATGEKRTGLKNRAPELYEFSEAEYKRLLKDGFQFKI